jgi:hypothetical protein
MKWTFPGRKSHACCVNICFKTTWQLGSERDNRKLIKNRSGGGKLNAFLLCDNKDN